MPCSARRLPAGLAAAALAVLPAVAAAVDTFRNPILDWGPDPFVTVHEGRYYLLHTQGTRIDLPVTADLAAARSARVVTVFTAPPGGGNAIDVWAPELHRIDGVWYIYYSATSRDRRDGNRRIWVLANPARDPEQGTWQDLGRLEMADGWAIDGSVFAWRGTSYFTWSSRRDGRQRLAIARMRSPTALGPASILAEPERDWELQGWPVIEAPAPLVHGDDLFLAYSGSGCTTDGYCLGLLRLSGDDPLDPAAWTRSPRPILASAATAYGPGHNCFFPAADGTGWWTAYHARARPGEGGRDERSVRIQPLRWLADGSFALGEPVGCDVELARPGAGRARMAAAAR